MICRKSVRLFQCIVIFCLSFGFGGLSVSTAAGASASEARPVLEIDLQSPAAPVSPMLYGLMTEEINYAYDGGLYAELIRNRAFLDDPAGKPLHWSAVPSEGAAGEIRVVDHHPLTDKLPKSLEVDVKAAEASHPFRVVNAGYWGIPVKPGTAYRAAFYVRGDMMVKNRKTGALEGAPFDGPLSVSLESADGATVYARAETPAVNGHWQKFELTLATGAVAGVSSGCRLETGRGECRLPAAWRLVYRTVDGT